MTIFAAYLAGVLTVAIIWNLVYVARRLWAGWRETKQPVRRVA
jgi:hypothetical protein